MDDTGSTVLYDPGSIDRQLWCEANKAAQEEVAAETRSKRGKKHGK